jgi:hypothetical protein
MKPDLCTPQARSPVPADSKQPDLRVIWRDVLGGLIYGYEIAAAA